MCLLYVFGGVRLSEATSWVLECWIFDNDQ